jgi:hypothetical protein
LPKKIGWNFSARKISAPYGRAYGGREKKTKKTEGQTGRIAPPVCPFPLSADAKGKQ